MDGIESAYVEMYTRRNFDLDFDVCDNNLLSMPTYEHLSTDDDKVESAVYRTHRQRT